MIDKNHLRNTMLALTEAELEQAHKTYERFLSAARLDRTEPIENDEQGQAETAADLAEAFDDREHQVEAKISALNVLDFGPKTEVAPGAAVRIGDRYLVIGVSTGEFSCQGQKFIGVSEPNSKRVERFQLVVVLSGRQTERSHACPGLKPLAGSIGGLERAMQAT